MASISARPVPSPLSRRNSSAAMTTTSSRPCTVTCWGPSLRTRRTNSLNRALASCSSQWPGRDFAVRGLGDLRVRGILVILTRLSLCWPLILDEAPTLPALFPVLRSVIDEARKKHGRFFLLGRIPCRQGCVMPTIKASKQARDADSRVACSDATGSYTP
jgi:hypothetical protein